jgi:release factor glutamine methyltransferase
MNFKELRQQFTTEISEIFSDNESSSLFYIILEHLMGWKITDYIINSSGSVSIPQQTAFFKFARELKKGKPIQYILGETFFYGLKFSVNQEVLIPRPETEELVELILEKYRYPKALEQLSVLDIGTGSGCIAISLKKNRIIWDVSAIDVSKTALEVAVKNAESNHVIVTFIQADILKYKSNFKYDIIVSNPPYIKNEEQKMMQGNVLDYEPHLALFVTNEDPLIFYRVIAEFALLNLKDKGALFFEINESLGHEMIDILEKKGFKEIELKKDMQQKDRMICCRR